MLKKENYYFYVFVVLVALYAILVLTLPVSKLLLAYYHLSLVGLRFIELTYLIPQILIWSAAYYAYTRIITYSDKIGQDRDGQQIRKIGIGIAVLAFGGPINGIISSLLNDLARTHIHLIPRVTITDNYLAMLIPLIAFMLIGLGASGLLNNIKGRIKYREILILNFLFVMIAGGFCYLVFHKLPNSLSLGLAAKPIYFLPNWLLLFTIVVPYLFIWIVGGFAVLNMRAYQHKVKGIIYKKSTMYFEAGITLIIISYIVLEYLTTVSSKLSTLKILPLLLIIYPLLALVGLGYFCLAVGAKKLQKIEES